MTDEKREYFPLFVSSENKNVLVVGGGKIAERRIKTLLNFSFNITVVAPEITDELKKILDNADIIFHQREFLSEDLCEKYMVITATNNREVNAYIGKLCRVQNIFVSVADKREECDFYFPAIIFDEDIVIGLTSGGKSHKSVAEKAKKLREAIENADKSGQPRE